MLLLYFFLLSCCFPVCMGSAIEEFQENFKALVDLANKECTCVRHHLNRTMTQLNTKGYLENAQMGRHISLMGKNVHHIIAAFHQEHPDLRIETPVSADDENCTKTLFEGTELLKNNPKMKRFDAFFQRFDRLRPSLTANLEREGECDTERKNAKKFIEKLITFIRKLSSRNARV
ncbi:hypothetical protein ASZ78_000510 [Callipepla squamata]|uniref:Interleukin-5 n=1 Tax=Callipepla squamata TaxID=9009 RepID=A0A226MPW7_CALSU|nr:hypothetical protein ASZ78_000510 [Callipepla squamata]